MSPTATRTKAPAADPACLEAIDLARDAAIADAGADAVGEHLGYELDDERVVTHLFASTLPGYSGWRWAVTVVRASRAKQATVDEVVQIPGPEALVAPPWVPWQERLRPGDLGVGDLLPTRADDDRLVPGYLDVEDPDEQEVVWELGLGRARVLSRLGRDDAVDRWYSTNAGPQAPIAAAAPKPCGSCGFWLPLAGALHGAFGACANEFAPDDGRVVSADHGCGAHSEAMVLETEDPSRALTTPMELEEFEVLDSTIAVAVNESPAEEFGHS